MADVENVIKAWNCCNPFNRKCKECPYEKDCYHDGISRHMVADAVAMLKSQHAEIERLQPKKGKWIFTGQKNVYGGTVIQCPFCDDKYAAEHPCSEHFCRNCGAKLMD